MIRGTLKYVCNLKDDTNAMDVEAIDLLDDEDDENDDNKAVKQKKKKSLPAHKLAEQRKQQKRREKKKRGQVMDSESESEREPEADGAGDVDAPDFIVPDNVVEYADGRFEVEDGEGNVEEHDILPAMVMRQQHAELQREYNSDDEGADFVFDEVNAKIQCAESAQALLTIRDEFMEKLNPIGQQRLLDVATDLALSEIGNDCVQLDFHDLKKVYEILHRLKSLHAQIERQQGPLLREIREDLISTDTKVTRVMTIINTHIHEGPMVVCSCFLRTLHLIEGSLLRNGWTCAMFSGKLEIMERSRILTAFDSGEIDVLLLSQRCGGEGISLVRSNRMIMTDLDLSPSLTDQVMARIHRFGQTRQAHVHRLAMRGTIEEFTRDLLKQKRAQINRVMVFGDSGDGGGGDGDGDNHELHEELPEISSLALGVIEKWQFAYGPVPKPSGPVKAEKPGVKAEGREQKIGVGADLDLDPE
jgi:superfamily II DNA/RNA helicase